MPNWNHVLEEINGAKSPLDTVRRKYLKDLHEKTGRNIIAYYSGWLQKKQMDPRLFSIDDFDKNGFMSAIHGLDKSMGLDLMLHTPGGDITATESIVFYLKSIFGNNIRAIIPQIAMSAGTMIACSCKEIVMGKQSNLGPMDPQFSGIPAQEVISEFERAKLEVKKDPSSIPIWQAIISKYHPTFIGECQHAIDMSSSIVKKWLEENMLSRRKKREELAKKIMDALGSHKDSKTHSRHIHYEEAKKIGLKISLLEDMKDNLQDLYLTVHHAYMHTFSQSTATKIIENHNGVALINHHPGK